MQLIDVNVVTTSWREINGISLNIADLYACSWFTKRLMPFSGFHVTSHLYVLLLQRVHARGLLPLNVFQAGAEVQLFPAQEA